jgi:ubiquinone/menaquinone biosynthesis C-methylase UbiE
VDAINIGTMRSRSAVRQYARDCGLQPRERAALESVADEFRGDAILDLGVGAGRTVAPLRELSRNYLGIDYSPEMVAECRQRYPGVKFELADARDLSTIPDASIGLAFFSCNGLSMVGHQDRLRILREVNRTLKPGGVFIVTTYNQNSDDESARYRFPPFEFSPNPLRLALRAARFVKSSAVGYLNWRRYQGYSVRTTEYSMINDLCHDYATMLYYISLKNQREQLAACGFEPDGDAFNHAGERIDDDTRQNDYAIIARKPAVRSRSSAVGR